MVAQTKLLDFSESHVGRRFLGGFQDSLNRQHHEPARMPDGFVHALQVRTLREADPVYIAPHIMDMVDDAQDTFEPEVLLPSDPFTPIGFCLLPRPLQLEEGPETRDRTGLTQAHFRAISWMPIHSEDLETGCFWVSLYTHIDDDPDEAWQGYGDVRDESVDDIRRFWHTHSPLGLSHTFQWTWGKKPWEDAPTEALIKPEVGEAEEDIRRRAREQSRMIQAFWRICQQAIPAKHRAPRGIWKDANRKGIQHKDVTVITLRRAIDPREYEPTGRQQRVQCLVRGYWRKQHTRDGLRQVWVRPHLRGPEDGPYQETTRVFEVTR